MVVPNIFFHDLLGPSIGIQKMGGTPLIVKDGGVIWKSLFNLVILDFRLTSINSCYINGHGPIHCGSSRCPFQPDFSINRTSIEEDIREKIEKLKHFCKIVFHSEVNYHLKPIKSLVKSIIKKIKFMLGKVAQKLH